MALQRLNPTCPAIWCGTGADWPDSAWQSLQSAYRVICVLAAGELKITAAYVDSRGCVVGMDAYHSQLAEMRLCLLQQADEIDLVCMGWRYNDPDGPRYHVVGLLETSPATMWFDALVAP